MKKDEICPGCGAGIKRPYITTFKTDGRRKVYICPECGIKFAIWYENRQKGEGYSK